jgi:hypothetical protein
MSPGALVSTGYIAGGTIAGVLLAFLSFNDRITNMLADVGRNVPHQTTTAIVTFLMLAAFLVLAGRGWVKKKR